MAAPLAKRLQVKPGRTILDMTADRGCEAVTGEIEGVSQVAVDATWSALRFEAVADVGRRGERGVRR
jgi:hypothetical protein